MTEPAHEPYPEVDQDQVVADLADLDAAIQHFEAKGRRRKRGRARTSSNTLRRLREGRSQQIPAAAVSVVETAEAILGRAKRAKKGIYQEIGQAARANARTFPLPEEIETVVGSDSDRVDREIRRLARVPLGAAIVVPGPRHRLSGRPAYAGGALLSPYLVAALIGACTDPGDTVWEFGPAMVPAGAYPARVLGRDFALLQMPSEATPRPQRRLGTGRAPTLVVAPLPLPVDPWSLYQHYRVAALGEEQPWAFDDEVETHPEFAISFDRYAEAVELRLRLLRDQVVDPLVAIVTPDRAGLPRGIDKLIARLSWRRVANHWVYEQPSCAHIGDGSAFGGFSLGIWRPR